MIPDDGSKFGLPAIGTSGTNLSTGPSDTKRSAFPSLATKGSVFSWLPTVISLVPVSTLVGVSGTVNLRNNTAGGSSADIPTWAAGAVVLVTFNVSALGGTTFITMTLSNSFGILLWSRQIPTINFGFADLVVVPFYDDPSFTYSKSNNLSTGAGTASGQIDLVGYVRNV